MLTAFWEQHGVVMMDFLTKGTTMTRAYCVSLRGDHQCHEAWDVDRMCVPPSTRRPWSRISHYPDRSEALWLRRPHPPNSPDLHNHLTFTWSHFRKAIVSKRMRHWVLVASWLQIATCGLHTSPLQREICCELRIRNQHVTSRKVELYACAISTFLDKRKRISWNLW